MTFKKPDQLTDEDLKIIVVSLLQRTQALEVHLAEAVCLALCALDEIEPPTEAEYEFTVSHAVEFLKRISAELKALNDTTEQLLENEARKN